MLPILPNLTANVHFSINATNYVFATETQSLKFFGSFLPSPVQDCLNLPSQHMIP